VTRLAQPPIQFVVLVADVGRVEASDRFERRSVEHAQVDGVGRSALAAVGTKAGAALSERRHQRRCHRLLKRRRSDRSLNAADVGCAGLAQGGDGSLDVVGRQDAVRVDAHDDFAGACLYRGVQPVRRRAGRVLDHGDLRSVGGEPGGEGGGFVARWPNGNREIDRSGIGLGEHCVDGGFERARGIQSREDCGDGEMSVGGADHLPNRSAVSIDPLNRAE